MMFVASIVVFVTTYTLILPAIALNSDEATEEAGFYTEDDAAEEDAAPAAEETDTLVDREPAEEHRGQPP